MLKYVQIFLICGLMLGGLSQAQAANVPSSNSVVAQNVLKQSKVEAENLLEQGNYDAAFEAYGRLLREDPTSPVVNLGYARAAVHVKKPGQAVMAYERLLAQYPDEPILLKELAYALSMQNDDQRSSMELAKNAEASTAENIDLAAKWKKQHKRTQISGKIRAGLLYDSNVNSGPASNDISLGDWDLTLIDGKSQDSLAAYMGANIDVGHRLDIVSPWWIVGSASVFARYNTHEKLYDMDLTSSEFVAGSAGVRYLGKDVLFDFRARAQIFDYAFLQNVVSVGPEANFVYAITPKVHLITRASIDWRDYSEHRDYDGWYGSVGQYVRVFVGDGGHNITLGGRYLGGTAYDAVNSYDGFEASINFMIILPLDIRLTPFVSYGGEYFHGPATTLEEDYRQDHRLRAGINIDIPISESWSIELGYQYMNNLSNSELYTYDQHVANAGISWSF